MKQQVAKNKILSQCQAKMSDTESNHVEENEPQVEHETPKKAPAKGKMTEQKILNLEKARAARKANLDAKKYSKEKRSAAEERIQLELERRAEELAEKKALELLEKQKQEAELEEYRQWKKEQAKLAKEKEMEKVEKATKKKAPKAPPAPKPKPKKKVTRKVASDSEESEDELPRKKPAKRVKQQYVEDDYPQPSLRFNLYDMID